MKLQTSFVCILLCICLYSTHAFSSAARIPHSAARITRIRAGGNASKLQPTATTAAATATAEAKEVQVTVRSSLGSKWLDRHCTLRVSPSTTVRELRDLVQKAFPGNPPAALQRLFLESRLLADNEKVAQLVGDADADRLVLKLDWVPLSTTQYSTTGATVDEMLSATVSLRTAIQFANQMAAALADEERSSELLRSPKPITAPYQKQVESETKVLPEVFKDQLAIAHAKQADPVEQVQYNEDAEKSLTPAMRALLKFVNVDSSTLQRNAMLAAFFVAVMFMGSNNPLAAWIALFPFLHLFRPVRYWTKVVRYLLPPLSGVSLRFFQPLLSPSDIAISQWSGVWRSGEEREERRANGVDSDDEDDEEYEEDEYDDNEEEYDGHNEDDDEEDDLDEK